MLPLFLTIMSESTQSEKFIKDYKERYGRELYIKKVIDPFTKGEPDIQAIYKGMPLFAEAKLLHSSYKNTHPFTEIQLYNLSIKAQAGAICIGILYHKNEIRYLMYNQLKEYLSKEDWDKAEEFNWENLRLIWLKIIADF